MDSAIVESSGRRRDAIFGWRTYSSSSYVPMFRLSEGSSAYDGGYVHFATFSMFVICLVLLIGLHHYQWALSLAILTAMQFVHPNAAEGFKLVGSINLILIMFFALVRGENWVLNVSCGLLTLFAYMCHCLVAANRVHYPLLIITALLTPFSGESSGSVQEIANTFPYPNFSAFLMLVPMLTDLCNFRTLWMIWMAFALWAMTSPISIDFNSPHSTLFLHVVFSFLYLTFWGADSLKYDENLDLQYSILANRSKEIERSENGGENWHDKSKSFSTKLIVAGHVLAMTTSAFFTFYFLKRFLELTVRSWSSEKSVIVLILIYVLFMIVWIFSGYQVKRETRFVGRTLILLGSSVIIERMVVYLPDYKFPENSFPIQTVVVLSAIISWEIVAWSFTLSKSLSYDDFRIFHLFIACYGHAEREVLSLDSTKILALTSCIVDVLSGNGLFHKNHLMIFISHAMITGLELYAGISTTHKIWSCLMLIPLLPRKVDFWSKSRASLSHC